MKRSGLFTLLTACLLLLHLPAAAGAAGTTTGIIRAHANVDVYSYTPSETGYLSVTTSFTEPQGGTLEGFPAAEVDTVVQSYQNGEPYYDLDIVELYLGTNPSTAQVYVPLEGINRPFYFTVSPFVAETSYNIVVDFQSTSTGVVTRVIDAIGSGHPTTGDLYVPATADAWISQIQQWPGTLQRSLGLSDVYAQWDEYGWTRDGANWFVNNFGVEFTAPTATTRLALPYDGGYGYSLIPGQWVTYGPQIWNGAARPNVWNSILTDTFPMPGSLTVAEAPAWCTWGYNDSAAPTSMPAYAFGARIVPGASGQSLSFQPEAGAEVSYAFLGDGLTWLNAKGPAGGRATVTVDGVVRAKVDQYAPEMSYGWQLTLSGLGAGQHTVVLSSDGGLYHDAFRAPTDIEDPTPLAEDHSDGSTRYKWAVTTARGASGGKYSRTAVTDAATAFTFSGTEVTWQFVPRPDGGIAEVWIDGVKQASVDQYQAGPAKPRKGKKATVDVKTVTYGGLDADTHTIFIRVTGTANPLSTGTVVTSDAFVVGGVTFED